MRRVLVVGCSGSGKTTLAGELARRLGAPHVELDSLYHQPGWTPLPRAELRAAVAQRLSDDAWVVEGNYDGSVQDLVLARADTVVWLDLPRPVVMRRVIGRTLRRVFARVELWNGNRERWANLVDPRPDENIILWAFTRHGPYRRTYERKSADPTWAHLSWHRLRTSARVAAFLREVPGPTCSPGSPPGPSARR